MLWDQIAELRHCIENKNWPLSFDKWPGKLANETNCLAFSLGLNLAGPDYDYFVSLNPEIPWPRFNSVFERLLNELGGLAWRKINCVDEAFGNEYVLQIYGFYPVPNSSLPDFHVIRRELDGTWVHKPDFKNVPEILNYEEFLIEYPNNEISGTYAVKKKAH